MADRMRVPSLVGATEGLDNPSGTSLLKSWSEVRNHGPPGASNLLRRQVLSPPAETTDEYSVCLAPSPRLLRRAARHRAVAWSASWRWSAAVSSASSPAARTGTATATDWAPERRTVLVRAVRSRKAEPRALRSATPPQVSHFRQSASDTSTGSIRRRRIVADNTGTRPRARGSGPKTPSVAVGS